MKKFLLFLVCVVASFAILIVLLWPNEPTLLEGNGDEVIKTYLNDTTTITVVGEATATVTVFFETKKTVPLIIEVRHNNEIVLLQEMPLPLGVTGTLYAATIQVTGESKLSHAGANDFQVFIDGTFSATVEKNVFWDQFFIMMLVGLLATLFVILIGGPKFNFK